jgi:excinuclease ABC subunit A
MTDRIANPRGASSPVIVNSMIQITGARTHNLQNLQIEIPVGKLTVITGVSGSGKSSLVFDTIFAEGRRRYLSSVSVRSRELLQKADRPDIDLIEGLPPVLMVSQGGMASRPEATVATISEINEYLRLLYARVGQLYCPDCGKGVSSQSRSVIVEQALKSFERQKLLVLAPIVRQRTGLHHEIFTRIVKDGYVRARVDGELVDVANPPQLLKSQMHDIEIVVDRLMMKPGIQSRLEESVDTALQLGQGQCLLSHETDAGWVDRLYSSHLACVPCGTSFPILEPRSFSFRHPLGACPACQGSGLDPLSGLLPQLCGECQGTRLGRIPRSVRIQGISISDFCSMTPTAAVNCVAHWQEWFMSASTESPLDDGHRAAGQYLLPEIAARLQFLVEVGLDYLTLDRGGQTLSAGEQQRVRLAGCLGSDLTGVCYLLDEPTAGLHAMDTDRLLRVLCRLRDAGNTLIVVEHDLDVIRAADYVIDLGPGAGVLGGQLLAAGTAEALMRNSNSITGQFLRADEQRTAATDAAAQTHFAASSSVDASSVDASSPLVRLTGATLHHLKQATIEFPLGKIVCVTGVSGSGKSSLVMQTLVPAIRQGLGERNLSGGPFHELTGFETLSRLVRVDQSPLGHSSRSSPVTYSGLWGEIRQVFAKTRESRLRGFTSRQFTLQQPAARCPCCGGRGTLAVDEQRFADWQIRCPECDGQRFSVSTLSVRYRGRSVADVLEMSISEGAAFFQSFPRLFRTLSMFEELGLGYLKLGQPASTLSGGESQRIKLGTELAKPSGLEGATLFVLDEPTSGLHVADVGQLVSLLRRLTAGGDSVLVIEHHRELIASAAWRIDMGPGSGLLGGEVIFCGPQ